MPLAGGCEALVSLLFRCYLPTLVSVSPFLSDVSVGLTSAHLRMESIREGERQRGYRSTQCCSTQNQTQERTGERTMKRKRERHSDGGRGGVVTGIM